MNHVLRALAVVALVTLLSGCSTFAPRSKKPSVLVVLFDLSHSTDGAVVRQRYLEDFRELLLALKPQERLLAGVIDSNSLSGVDLPIDFEVPTYSSLETNRYVYDEEVESRRSDALAVAEKLLARRDPSAGTDLFGGFLLAQDLFDAYPNAAQRRLVLFTDGLHTSEFALGRSRLSATRISALLDRLEASQQVPELTGVEVAIVGAGNGRRQLHLRELLSLERFWRSFVSRTGATIGRAGYAPRLIAWR